jgi:hypothetical protein
VIACVVDPFDHAKLLAELDVKITLPPWQKVVLLPGVIVGIVGFKLTVTAVVADVAEHPEALVTVTE